MKHNDIFIYQMLFFMPVILFNFLKKVSKKRHSSRIASLTRSFGMTKKENEYLTFTGGDA